MNNTFLEILFLFLLLIINGVFAMSEIALISSRKIRLQQMAKEGDAGAKAALEISETPNRFLSTVQIGITLIGIMAGAIGGATLHRQISHHIKQNSVVGRLQRCGCIYDCGVINDLFHPGSWRAHSQTVRDEQPGKNCHLCGAADEGYFMVNFTRG